MGEENYAGLVEVPVVQFVNFYSETGQDKERKSGQNPLVVLDHRNEGGEKEKLGLEIASCVHISISNSLGSQNSVTEMQMEFGVVEKQINDKAEMIESDPSVSNILGSQSSVGEMQIKFGIMENGEIDLKTISCANPNTEVESLKRAIKQCIT